MGVLALQGDFERHVHALEIAGACAVEVRTAAEMQQCDGLVIPGGESTTMLKLLNLMDLKEPLREYLGLKSVFGTCAGAILMAKEVLNPAQECFGAMDLTVERNGYGRQVDSRVVQLSPSASFTERMGEGALEAVFIRAPIVRRAGAAATVLAEYEGNPVLLEQGRHMVATFHPELTDLTKDTRVHKLFLTKL